MDCFGHLIYQPPGRRGRLGGRFADWDHQSALSMVAVDQLAIGDSADFNPASFWAIH
jgi:hypothetical protein